MFKPLIAITMGDAAGSGPEIIVKVLKKRNVQEFCKPVIIGDAKVFEKAIEIVGAKHLNINVVKRVEDLVDEPNTMNILDLNNVDIEKLVYGKPSAMTGKAAAECIIKAVELALSGRVHAIATAPISKEGLHMAGYRYLGHTELLADLTKTKNYVMMLVVGDLRVSHVTTHVSLKKAIELIKKERILKVIELTYDALVNWFNISNPKIAVAGLNPHAGEGGLLGDEEIKEIRLAIEEAKSKGIEASGPYPPDSIFYRAYYGKEFDAVVAMYHDQGHIAVKMIGFMEGVNVTLGLPIIRTSPDHGTAWDKAGKGTADETSMYNAIKLAAMLSQNINIDNPYTYFNGHLIGRKVS